jgi:hypothetical protein
MTRINELGSEPLKPYREALRGLKGCSMYSNTVIDKTPCGLETLWPLVAMWQRIDVKAFFDWSVEVRSSPLTPNPKP